MILGARQSPNLLHPHPQCIQYNCFSRPRPGTSRQRPWLLRSRQIHGAYKAIPPASLPNLHPLTHRVYNHAPPLVPFSPPVEKERS